MIKKLDIPDIILFQSTKYFDDRGFFSELFNKNLFDNVVQSNHLFVQDNFSVSALGVLRGLHYQLPPFDQGKLVRVVHGKIRDVAVDIRKSSKFFGKHIVQDLDSESMDALWIPPGFAHGFLSLHENSKVLYKTTDFYNKESERSILWDDQDLSINWGFDEDPIISDKDKMASLFKMADKFE